MKHFTMNVPKLNQPAATRFRRELACDPSGRLFDPRVRQLMASTRGDIAAIEALAAVRIVGKLIHLSMERWADRHDLSEGRLQVLFRLMRQGEVPLGDLADNLDVSPRNITGLIDHLERDGLVERIPDPDDRRSVRARLTANGRTRIEGIWREALESQIPVTNGFTKEELGQLRHLCLRLVENIQKEGER